MKRVLALAVLVAAAVPMTAAQAAPVAADDSYEVEVGRTFTLPAPGVLRNDTGVGDDPIVQWQTAPPRGLTLHDDGGITYPVPLTEAGTATFTYCLLDLRDSPNAQCVSNKATVTIRYVTPRANDDAVFTVAGNTLVRPAPGVLENDTGLPPNPVVHWQTPPPAGFALADDGAFRYDVPANAAGTYSFTYCVLDRADSPDARCISNRATVSVRVVGADLVDDEYTVEPGTTFTLAAPGVLDNDDSLPFIPIVQWQSAPPAGLVLARDGSITYPVPTDATGTATFRYCILDVADSPNARCVADPATVTIRYGGATPSPSPSASASASPSATATASASAPSASTSTSGAPLPRTGAPAGRLFVLGLALVVAGGGLVLVLRRRRETS